MADTRATDIPVEELIRCSMFLINPYITGFQIIWTIHNYLQLKMSIPTNKCIEMKKVVNLSFFEKCLWTMRLYPSKKIPDKSSNQVSSYILFCRQESSIKNVWALFYFKVLDKFGKVAFAKESSLNAFNLETETIDGKVGWGHDFLMNEDTPEQENLLQNGSLSIVIEGGIWTKQPAGGIGDLDCILRSRLNVLTSSLDFLTCNQYTDVIFNVHGKQFQFHKILLGAASDVFNKLFVNGKDSSQNIIEITDVNPDVFHELVYFIYTKSVTQHFYKISDLLLIAAQKYGISELKLLCEKNLLANISIDKVTWYYVLAAKYSAETLRKKSLVFIQQNGKAVKETEYWKNLSLEPEIAISLLNLLLE